MLSNSKLPAFASRCRPGRFVAEAQAHAVAALNPADQKRSRAADGILYALADVLLLAAVACRPARVPAEHATPAGGRYAWHWEA